MDSQKIQKNYLQKYLSFCFLAGCGYRCAHTWRRAAIRFAGPIFIYAENYGEFEGRVFSDQVSKPEGPHNTTAALSAKSLYHTHWLCRCAECSKPAIRMLCCQHVPNLKIRRWNVINQTFATP
jgi:hypothetical protein